MRQYLFLSHLEILILLNRKLILYSLANHRMIICLINIQSKIPEKSIMLLSLMKTNLYIMYERENALWEESETIYVFITRGSMCESIILLDILYARNGHLLSVSWGHGYVNLIPMQRSNLFLPKKGATHKVYLSFFLKSCVRYIFLTLAQAKPMTIFYYSHPTVFGIK